jgi:hypothetical protein
MNAQDEALSPEQMDAIARIKFLAADKRSRVLLDDHCDWLEEKLKEIKRLAKLLPGKAWKPIKGKRS